MVKTNISVTEAARNFADCVNRAHYQKICLGRDLAQALAKTDLSNKEAITWGRDLRTVRKNLRMVNKRR